MSIQRDKKNVPCPVLGEYPHFGNHCVKGNLAMAISPHTSGQRVCYIQIDVPWLPNTENDSLNEDVLGWWADTDCSSAWFSSIKEANRLLTPTSIPHGFTHTYKPISVTVVNTGLIIASPGQSRVPRVNPITKKSEVSIYLGWTRAQEEAEMWGGENTPTGVPWYISAATGEEVFSFIFG